MKSCVTRRNFDKSCRHCWKGGLGRVPAAISAGCRSFGTFNPRELLALAVQKGNELWHHNCRRKNMSLGTFILRESLKDRERRTENQLIESVDRLVNEMRAIEYWDVAYCENDCHEPYEEMAFASRQKRRTEIIGQLMLCGFSWDVLKWKSLCSALPWTT